MQVGASPNGFRIGTGSSCTSVRAEKDVVLVSGIARYDKEFDKIAPQVCGEVEVDIKLFLDTINVFSAARGRSYALSTLE